MSDISPELFDALRALSNMPTEVHWLCDATEFEDEQEKDYLCPLDKDGRVAKTKLALELFALPGQDQSLEWLKVQLTIQLSRCSNCVETYHDIKRDMRNDFLREYEPHVVETFFRDLTSWDVERLTPELQKSAQLIRSLPPEKRRMSQLSRETLYALYEPLCDPSLLQHQPLGQYFTFIFSAIQQKKSKLKVQNLLPAMITFLFEEDEGLKEWAIYTCDRQLKDATPLAFEKTLLPPLENAIRKANDNIGDQTTMQRFFKGAYFIVKLANKEIVGKSLCGANWDLVKFVANRVCDRAPYLEDNLMVVDELLRKLQYDFWDAVSPVSPTSFIDWVFTNPQIESILEHDRQLDAPAYRQKIEHHIRWVESLVESLRLSNRQQASSNLCNHLLKRFQDKRFPLLASTLCLGEGFNVLALSLVDLAKEGISGTVDHIIARTVMDLVLEHIAVVVDAATNPSPTRDIDELWSDVKLKAKVVLQSAIKVDCKVISEDFQVLSTDKPLSSAAPTRYSRALYDCVIDRFVHNDASFAIGILGSLYDLVGLEKLKSQDDANAEQNVRTAKLEYNKTLGSVNAAVGEILNRVSEMDPRDLLTIVTDENALKLIISSLFSPEIGHYLPSVDIIKGAYNQLDKVEALRVMLSENFLSVMGSFLWGIRRVKKMRTFGPMPLLVKTCGYLLQILCDAQDGLMLTQRTLSGDKEQKQLRCFWVWQWELLATIFEETIRFQKTQDRGALVEFTRDTMEYADQLFSALPVFEEALVSPLPESAFEAKTQKFSKVAAELLQYPNKVIYRLAIWLRLRDETLLGLCHSLLCKILKQLENAGVPAEEDAIQRLLKFATRGDQTKYKTNLTPQQKAELKAACGHTVLVEKAKKQTTLEKWATEPAADRPKPEVIEILDDLDEDGLDADSAVALEKPIQSNRTTGLVKQILSPLQKRVQSQTGRPSIPKAPEPPRMAAVARARADVAERIREKKEREAREKATKETKLQSNVGLNLQFAGILPKEPEKKKRTLEDSSSEEDEGDDDNDDGMGLFSLSTKKKPQTMLIEPVPRATIRPGTFTLQKQARSAADVRARLTPDLSPLYRRILNWDFFHDNDFPPGSDEKTYSMVKYTFDTVSEYQKTFEPLLMLECWNQFRKAKEEDNFTTFSIELATRMNADNFVELHMTMDQDGYVKQNLYLSESDILLISTAARPLYAPNEPNCLARVIGLNKKLKIVELSLRCLPSTTMLPALKIKAKYNAVKILSLTPLEREYGSMLSLTYYDLQEEILKARPTPIESPPEERIRQVGQNYKLNDPQAKAVIAAMDNDGFTLIQGPPGSGKTKTVIGIVGGILSPLLGAKTATSLPGQPRPSASKKLLVCAPSNAAVDELVIRFKEGIRTISGQDIRPKLVRLGRSDAINAAVKDVTLEELVDSRLEGESARKSSNGSIAEPAQLREEMNKLIAERDAIRAAKDDAFANGNEQALELRARERELSEKIKAKGRQLDAQRDSQSTDKRNFEILRRKIQQEIMNEVEIICATLSGSGHEMLKNINVELETVVIDEAAQSIELSALIPLKYGCTKCILVGDPKQLPPTVLSRDAARYMYEQSLFVRMQKNHPSHVHLLSIQYRMHPDISRFPSLEFYDGELKDGQNMEKLRQRIWHSSTVFGPYRFFDVQGQESAAVKGHSLVNIREVQAALAIYDRLVRDFPEHDFRGEIGIITPYKQQLSELKRHFRNKYGEGILKTIDFNTTDAFQGREREIIIFSCVRASERGGIGFLSDIRRMNVGLTRAKSSLFVLGNAQSLLRNEFWGKLVRDTKARNLYTDGDIFRIFSRPVRTGVKAQLLPPPQAMDIDDPRHFENRLPINTSNMKQNLPTAESRMTPLDGTEVDKDPRRRSKQEKNLGHSANNGQVITALGRPPPTQIVELPPANLIPPASGGFSEDGVNHLSGAILCFKCGEFGHTVRDGCPNPANSERVRHRKKYETGNSHERPIPQVKSTISRQPKPSVKRQASDDIVQTNKRHQPDSTNSGPSNNIPRTNEPPHKSQSLKGAPSNADDKTKAAPVPPTAPRRIPPPPRKKEADLFIRPKQKPKPKQEPTVQPSKSDLKQRVAEGLYKKNPPQS